MTIDVHSERAKLDLYARLQQALGGGCGDGGCIVKRPVGQHTNGGCMCLYRPDEMEIRRMRQALGVAGPLLTNYRAALDERERLLAENERLRADRRD